MEQLVAQCRALSPISYLLEISNRPVREVHTHTHHFAGATFPRVLRAQVHHHRYIAVDCLMMINILCVILRINHSHSAGVPAAIVL